MNRRVSGCCCFSLRTGSLFLGYLGLIGNIILSLAIIGTLPFLRKWMEEPDPDAEFPMRTEKREEVILIFQVILVILLIGSLISGLFSVLLLVGVYKENPRILKICVIIMVITIVTLALYNFGILIQAFLNPSLFLSFLTNGMVLALQVYCAMVVNSYRLRVLEGGEKIECIY